MLTQELRNLYYTNQERFTSIKKHFSDPHLHGPYLCSPSELYLQQPIRIVCVGQETYGWGQHDDIDQQMNVYKEFNLGKEYKSLFWRYVRRLEQIFTGLDYSSAALNINRYDFNRKRPNVHQAQIISQLDNILAEEVSLLKPDVCIFFTSHAYDSRLEKLYPGLEKQMVIEHLPITSICKLKHPTLPLHTYRTYHPAFLNRRSEIREPFLKFMTETKSNLNK